MKDHDDDDAVDLMVSIKNLIWSHESSRFLRSLVHDRRRVMPELHFDWSWSWWILSAQSSAESKAFIASKSTSDWNDDIQPLNN